MRFILVSILVAVPLASAGDLVGHWKLDEGSGTAISDSSEQKTNGRLLNGVSWAEGISGKALWFDGTDDYVQIPRSSAFESRAITIAAWIRREGAQQVWANAVRKTYQNNTGPTWTSWSLQLNPNNSGSDLVVFETGSAGANHVVTSAPGALPDGAWVHVTGAYDPAGPAPQKRLYVNGALSASATETQAILYDTTPTGDLLFGQNGRNGEYFKGLLDDIRVFNRALTADEIKSLATGAIPGKPAASPAPTPAAAKPVEARRGAFSTSFAERGAIHQYAIDEDVRRLGLDAGKVRRSLEYDITKESFEVFVPKDYDPAVPHGLFVWINSVDSGQVPGEWHPVFEKHRMISVGANKCGNDRNVVCRIGLAVDAVCNMRKMYAIDEERIYLGGLSGGSHCACDGAIDYSDVFQGGYYICAAHPRKYKHPAVETAKRRSRFVFCTGEKDNLRDSVIGTCKEYGLDGYAYTQLFDVPGMGHTTPPADWFEKGIVSLDAPLVAAAAGLHATALKLERAGKRREALEAYVKSALHGRGQPFFESARGKIAELRPKLNAESQEAFAELMTAKPIADRLKQFAREWSGYEGGRKAADEANRLGDEDLQRLLVKPGSGLRASLQKFLKDWEAFPVAAKALAALDKEAQPEFEKARAIAVQKTRHAKLVDFGVAWMPSTPAKMALALVEEEARSALEDIKALKSESEKLPKLVAFARDYKEIPAGKEALKSAEEIMSRSKEK